MESTSLLGRNSSNKIKVHKFERVTQSLYSGLGNLISLLPTGTIFLFQYLNPTVTNSGSHCTTFNKFLSASLLTVCSLNCIFATFTDSYTASDGTRRYGIVTATGLWPPPPSSEAVDMSAYRLRGRDLVHAMVSLGVFGVLGFLDKNMVRCMYPVISEYDGVLLKALPIVMGVISGLTFSIFPWKRKGIGY